MYEELGTKMEQQLLTQILTNTYTFSDLKNRVRALRIFLNRKLFITDKKLVAQGLQSNWLNSQDDKFYAQFTKENFYKQLQGLETQTKKLSPLIMYLAFESGEAENQQLGTWARQIFGNPQLVIDVKYNPDLIAGCALVWKGVYKDYSLKKKIEDQKEQILALFRKFHR